MGQGEPGLRGGDEDDEDFEGMICVQVFVCASLLVCVITRRQLFKETRTQTAAQHSQQTFASTFADCLSFVPLETFQICSRILLRMTKL